MKIIVTHLKKSRKASSYFPKFFKLNNQQQLFECKQELLPDVITLQN